MLLDSDEVHALVPTLGDAVTCGVRLADQRFINPGRFVHAARRCRTQSWCRDRQRRRTRHPGHRPGRRARGQEWCAAAGRCRGDRDRHLARIAGARLRRLDHRPGRSRLQLHGAARAHAGRTDLLPGAARRSDAARRRASCRRDDGVPQAGRTARPAPHQGDRRRGDADVDRRRLGRADRRVGRLASVHRRRAAAGRPYEVTSRVRVRRPRHVGHRPRPVERQAARSADRPRRGRRRCFRHSTHCADTLEP